MTFHRTTAALALTLAALAAPTVAAPLDGPTAAVDALYRGHFAHSQSFDETHTRDRARFAAPLLALLDADAKAARGSDEVVGLDFDPLTNSQEEAEGYSVGQARIAGDTATVPVELRTGRERMKLTVHLVRTGVQWQVSNLDYGEGNLVAILKELAAERRAR
jgi:hypothetical protein